MAEIIEAIGVPRLFLVALIVFAFLPGLTLRFVVRLYPKGHPRRKELLGELYARPYWERPFFVAQQFETAICEGVPSRVIAVSPTLRAQARLMSIYLAARVVGLAAAMCSLLQFLLGAGLFVGNAGALLYLTALISRIEAPWWLLPVHLLKGFSVGLPMMHFLVLICIMSSPIGRVFEGGFNQLSRLEGAARALASDIRP